MSMKSAEAFRRSKSGNVESSRSYLTDAELKCLFNGARDGRHGVRDTAMLHMLVRHGLRASELCGLLMDDLDLRRRDPTVYIARLKGSDDARHFIGGPTLRALRAWLRLRKKQFGDSSPYVFLSERGEPFGRSGIYYLVVSWAKRGFVPIHTKPHMLRHTCGYSMAEKGTDTRAIQGYLGHRDIRNTVEYTALSPERFRAIKTLWGM